MMENLLSTLFILIIEESSSFWTFPLLGNSQRFNFLPVRSFQETQPTLYDLLLIGHVPGNFMRTEIDFLSPTD